VTSDAFDSIWGDGGRVATCN